MIRVSELFKAVQGEGLYAGTPSVFLRTFGCNFRCPGFSVPSDQWTRDKTGRVENQEVLPLLAKAKEFKSLQELPILQTGCDTYAAVYPRFKHLTKDYAIDDLVDEIVRVNGGKFSENVHLVITGGEPLLGWQPKLALVLDRLYCDFGLRHVTFETNGTQLLERDIADLPYGLKVSFSISAKLACSGESKEDRFNKDSIISMMCKGDSWFKFVVGKEEDITEIKEYLQVCSPVPDPVVYLMPLGGHPTEYQKHEELVFDLALKYNYRFSPRLHVAIKGNGWGQ
ncbi:MAG TPA: 7-carboxy-7-deazaguanine synthase QueE [Coprothermobacter proteolyticus]|nr:7-carboxy-7-deazaguanine synthase QueE [Coprothermobacter proteolyticus]